MIDLHCHLLPDVDDGPPNLAAAVAMARLHVAAGVGIVAATPHVRGDLPNDAETISRGVSELREALAAAGVDLDVVAGAEIDVVTALALSDEELRRLALGGGRWLLLEAPLRPLPYFERAVGALTTRGHCVLLGHPERSPQIQHEIGVLRRLVAGGALVQITAGSLTGQFGRTVERFTDRLLDEGLVHVVASDAHDADRRPPGLTPALQQAGLSASASLLTELVPAAVLAGDPVPAVPARRRRHGLLERLGLR